MRKRIEKADAAVVTLLNHAATKWHPDLIKAQVRVTPLMVHPPVDKSGNPSGPALKLAGAPCVAKITVASARDRLLAKTDAIVEIAADVWERLDDAQRLALVDHELEHLIVKRDDKGEIQTHDDCRPCLATQPDDWVLTGFASVVERHGQSSVEVLGLRALASGCQLLFDFATGKASKPKKRKRNAGATEVAA